MERSSVRRRAPRGVLRAAGGVCVALAVALSVVSPCFGAPKRARSVLLSNESTFTRWAHPDSVSEILRAPRASARSVGRLHMLTEEGRPEVYLLLREVIVEGGAWVQLRAPARPNGLVGWVPRRALRAFHLTHWALRVDLRSLKATLTYEGRFVWSAPVGVGKRSTPTPTGRFWIRELLRVPAGTLYGPYAFGTSDYSTLDHWPRGGVVGIHGTNQPWLIPGRPSHGCIRMRNRAIDFLARHLPIGAPVRVES